MQKILAMAVSLAMLLTLVPAVDAGETKTAIYDVPSGPVRVTAAGESAGPGVSTRLCATEWDQWDPDNEEEDLLIRPNETYGTPGDGLDFVGEAAWDNSVGNACPAARGARDRGDDGALNMGVFAAGIQLEEDVATNFVITITDDAFDNSFFSFCIITAFADGGGDFRCSGEADGESGEPGTTDDTDDYSVNGCGSATLTTPVASGGPLNRPSAFVYGSFLDGDTLETCFASSGEMTVVTT